MGEPREMNLHDGLEVKWCVLCGSFTDHYRTGHFANTAAGVDGAGHVATDAIDDGDFGEVRPTPGVLLGYTMQG